MRGSTFGVAHKVILGLLVLLAIPGWVAFRIYRLERSYYHPYGAGRLLSSLDDLAIPGVRDVRIPNGPTSDLGAWFSPSSNGSLVILAHGTESDRTSATGEMRLLHRAGIGFLSFDFPGHGLSPGVVQWGAPERAALQSAVTWALQQPGVDSTRLGAIGLSYGGYIVAQVAAIDPRIKRVALVSAPSDGYELAYFSYRKWSRFGGWLALRADELLGIPPDTISPAQLVERIAPRPLLIIHGDADPYVSVDMARQLMERAREPKTLHIVPGGGHLGFRGAAGATYGAWLTEFFAVPAVPDTGSAPAK